MSAKQHLDPRDDVEPEAGKGAYQNEGVFQLQPRHSLPMYYEPSVSEEWEEHVEDYQHDESVHDSLELSTAM
jgi:hypothetical protein